ncbi:MAG: hypothetical protein AABW72_06160 [archaeon]
MDFVFDSVVQKGNNKGVGFLKISEVSDLFDINQQVRCTIFSDSAHQDFFSKIKKYSNSKGIYVPKDICAINDFFGKRIKVKLAKINGFYSKIGADGKFYIPLEVAQQLKLEDKDILKIKVILPDGSVLEKYSLVRFREHKGSCEYSLVLNSKLKGIGGIINLEKLQSQILKKKSNELVITKLLKGLNFARINNDKFIILEPNKQPIFLRSDIKLKDIAYYLGCYFADGTKRGNSWAIAASTLEQARFYLDMHAFLTFESVLDFTLSYTKSNKNNISESELIRIWESYLGITRIKRRFRFAKGVNAGKTNEYGTLIMRKHKMLLLVVYNRLLEILISEIIKTKNFDLAEDFICGVLEGDGCPNAKTRGHIIITTNLKELRILGKVFKCSGISYKLREDSKGKNNGTITIGSLEILKNFNNLKDKLFAHYPKRRKLLFERLKKVGGVRYMLGMQDYASSWVKAELKKQGLLNNKYKLTVKGQKMADYFNNLNIF